MLKQPIVIEPTLIIRDAVESDCEEMMRLIHELAVFEKLPEQVLITSQTLRQDGFGSHPLYSALVAEDLSCSPPRLVGSCLMFNIYSTWEGKCLHLEDLYVQADFRKRGIGKAFFNATYQIAIDTGCARLNFNVLDWNTDALAFYKSRGAVNLTDKEGWRQLRVTREDMLKELQRADRA